MTVMSTCWSLGAGGSGARPRRSTARHGAASAPLPLHIGDKGAEVLVALGHMVEEDDLAAERCSLLLEADREFAIGRGAVINHGEGVFLWSFSIAKVAVKGPGAAPLKMVLKSLS